MMIKTSSIFIHTNIGWALRFALATPGFRGREVDRREDVVAVEPEIPHPRGLQGTDDGE